MDNSKKIRKMYFVNRLNTVKIAEKLDITKQEVSRVLNSQWPEEYEAEKIRRINENIERRKIEKKEKRKLERNQVSDREDYECLKLQHESDVMGMSKSGKLSDKGIVFCCLSAFDVNESRDKLVYNKAFGRKPKDLPSYLSLEIDVY